MNPILRRSIVSITAIAVIAVLLWLRLVPGEGSASGQQGQSTQQEQPGVSVDGYIVQPEVFRETVYTTGNILADEEITVRPEASGRITAIHFREDSEVLQGDLLVKLNDAELQEEKNRITFQINLAEIRENRQKELLERSAIAQDDYDMALNELNTLKAQRNRVQAQIDKMEIRAPFNGVIGLKEVSVGSFVSPEVVITTLQKIDPVKVEFSVPERYRASVQRGQKVRFRVEGDEEYQEGEVYAMQPRIDHETRSLRIRALAPNPGNLIFPGAFARVEVDLSEIDNALLIPSVALVPEITGYKVFVFNDGRVTERPVQIGTRTDRRVQILEGLAAGDTVITTGLHQIREGMAVRLDDVTTEATSEVQVL